MKKDTKVKDLEMRRALCCAAMFAGLAMAAVAAEKGPMRKVADLTEPKVMELADGGVFRYRWHEPAEVKPGEKYPLVVLLHGAGERGTNNFAQLVWGGQPIADWFQRKGQEFYFIAGQVPTGEQWVNVPWASYGHSLPEQPSKSMAALIDLIGKVLASDRPVDHERVYATGISMGGYGTWDLISRKTEWFAAAMPICGGGDVAQAPRLRDLPIWIHHGDCDDAVPVWRGRAMIAALRNAGSHVARYTEYPGCGHFSWGPAYGDPKNLDWFFGKRRLARPEWAEVERTPQGLIAPAKHFEATFEFTVDGGETWHAGLVRRVPGFPIRLVDGAVVEAPPYSFNIHHDGKWSLTTKKDGRVVVLQYRNLKARPLPEF